jgi:hypothetical protein
MVLGKTVPKVSKKRNCIKYFRTYLIIIFGYALIIITSTFILSGINFWNVKFDKIERFKSLPSLLK